MIHRALVAACLLLVLFAPPSANALWTGLKDTLGYCSFTRSDGVECMRRHVDLNHDGVISVRELRIARRRFVPLSLRAASWLAKEFNVDTSTRTIVQNCRLAKLKKGQRVTSDMYFTPDDFIKTQKSCLPTQWALCQLKHICDLADEEDPKK